MTQEFLINSIKEMTGMYVDRSYLKRIYEGKCHPEKIIGAINQLLGIEN